MAFSSGLGSPRAWAVAFINAYGPWQVVFTKFSRAWIWVPGISQCIVLKPAYLAISTSLWFTLSWNISWKLHQIPIRVSAELLAQDHDFQSTMTSCVLCFHDSCILRDSWWFHGQNRRCVNSSIPCLCVCDSPNEFLLPRRYVFSPSFQHLKKKNWFALHLCISASLLHFTRIHSHSPTTTKTKDVRVTKSSTGWWWGKLWQSQIELCC